MNSIGVGGPTSVNVQNIQSLDLGKALLAVQYERASKLEDLIKLGIGDIQANSQKLSHLTKAATGLSSILATVDRASQSKEEKLTDVQSAAFRAVQHEVGKENGIYLGPDREALTVGDVTAAVLTISGAIDTYFHNQSLDMFRLQSLTNKRNEAFDTIATAMKKMQDSGSPFIGNMR